MTPYTAAELAALRVALKRAHIHDDMGYPSGSTDLRTLCLAVPRLIAELEACREMLANVSETYGVTHEQCAEARAYLRACQGSESTESP